MTMRSTGHRLYGSYIYEDTDEHPWEPQIPSPGRVSAKGVKARASDEPFRTTGERLYGSDIHQEESPISVVVPESAETKRVDAKRRKRVAGTRKSRLTLAGKR